MVMIPWLITGCSVFHPAAIQPEKVFESKAAPVLLPGQKIKVMSWNVQYMAGKNHVFFYDLLDGSGPDSRPSATDIAATLQAAALIIRQENPDIILLQEVDDGARRTDYQDQLVRLLELLPADYRHHTSTFYWKSSFVPHPSIMGPVGMKLATISKYQITQALRHQLPLRNVNALRQWFEIKRAVLETRLPIRNQRDFVVMNTHLSAYQRLDARQKEYYREKTELERLTDAYRSVPSLQEVNGSTPEKWYTHFPNDPRVTAPDRTIDFIFYSDKLMLGKHRVIQKETLHISDHFPIVAEFVIP